MNFSVSDTAEYGGYTRGPRLITSETKKEMKNILGEIQDGSFAKEFIDEYNNGLPNLTKMRTEISEHKIEKVGKELRKMMSWLDNNKD